MIDDFIKHIEAGDINDFKKSVGENSLLKYPGTYDFTGEFEKIEYQKNLKIYKDDLLYYVENPLTYTFNSDGFRTWEDFSKGGDVNIYLGCSNTFGLGIHQKHTWAYKLHEHISNGEKYWNIALPGNGIQTDFRTLYYILKTYENIINVKNIFHWADYHFRFEFFDNYGPRILSTHDYTSSDSNIDTIKNNLLVKTNNKLNYISNINAIQNLSNNFGANYHICNFEYLHKIVKPNIKCDINFNRKLSNLLARDLLHPSYVTHHKMFESMLTLHNRKL